jgi:hypothetical protein
LQKIHSTTIAVAELKKKEKTEVVKLVKIVALACVEGKVKKVLWQVNLEVKKKIESKWMRGTRRRKGKRREILGKSQEQQQREKRVLKCQKTRKEEMRTYLVLPRAVVTLVLVGPPPFWCVHASPSLSCFETKSEHA